MRAKEYDVLVRAVEEGVSYGWMRAHKHTSKPDDEAAKIEIANAVVSEICEWFDFEFPALEEQEDE